MSNQTDTCKHLQQNKYICDDQESNPGQLLNKQQYTPLYHHHCGEKKESQSLSISEKIKELWRRRGIYFNMFLININCADYDAKTGRL